MDDFSLARRSHRERVDEVLRNGCGGDVRVAMRILEHHPDVARDGLLTTVVSGDLAEVDRRLALNPSAASAKGGPLDWGPLLYLAYSRLPLADASENAVAIARLLLGHGADPNTRFDYAADIIGAAS